MGVTSDLNRRITEHKENIGSVFCKKYNLTDLVYNEEFDDVNSAIQREKQVKNWKREWKLNLIKIQNPEMLDLFEGI